MVIGDRLKTLREAKDLSQGDIEKRSGLLRCYVSRVENGHTVPSVETLEKFAAASSRLSLHPRTPRICPGEPERYTCIYKDGGTRTFSRRRWFGLGNPIVPVVQPSKSHMRKDTT